MPRFPITCSNSRPVFRCALFLIWGDRHVGESEEVPIARKLGEFFSLADGVIRRVLETQANQRLLGTGQRVGEMLVDLNEITQAQLDAAIREQRIERLLEFPLFVKFTREEVAELAECVTEVSANIGDQTIKQDTPAGFLDFVISGRLIAYRQFESGEESPLAGIFAGEIVGEAGYFSDDNGTRTASVRALEESHMLRLSYENLNRYFERRPRIAVRFLDVIIHRLREVSSQYQKSVHRSRTAERSLRSLSRFLDMSNQSELDHGVDGLINRVVTMASTVMNADRATLFLMDPQTGDLWSKVADGEQTKEIRVPRGVGVAGWVAVHGDIQKIDDAYGDVRFNREVDIETGYRTRNILCGPVLNLHGETIGVVQVINKLSGEFKLEDVELFKAFAHQAAVAVENFNLYRQLVSNHEKMAIMLDVASSVTQTLDIGALITKIVRKIAEILFCDRASFFVFDQEKRELWSMVAQGVVLKEIRFPAAQGLAGHAVLTNSVVNIQDAYSDDRFNPEFDRKTGYRTRSVLCVPVPDREGRVMGVTQAINKLGGDFDDADIEMLQAISSQIGIAVENAQVHAEVARTKSYLESVQESISNGIITLDNNYTIITLNRAASELLGGSREKTVGMNIRDLLAASDENERFTQAIQEVYKGHTSVMAYDTTLAIGPDSSFMLNLNVLPLQTDEGEYKGVVMVMEDITREKRVKSTLTRYLAQDIVDRMLKDPSKELLGGDHSKATVVFSDIRGFTTLAEKMTPNQTVEFLNEYFTIMVDEVLKQRGVLDKFIGDAIMAVFGIPYAQADDATRAVSTSIHMLNALDGFNARRIRQGQPLVAMGIGINTDDVVSGNIGSEKRMDFTVIGDGVNVSSRLEGLTKIYGSQILISESTLAELDNRFVTRFIDHVKVKGRERPLRIFEVLGDRDYRVPAAVADAIAGHDAFFDRDFEKAAKLLAKAADDDSVAEVFLKRAIHFLAHPPADDWDGTWTATTK